MSDDGKAVRGNRLQMPKSKFQGIVALWRGFQLAVLGFPKRQRTAAVQNLAGLPKRFVWIIDP